MSFLNNGITGHRGDPQHFPQNTIAGFESAIKMGCDWVETDMHFTGDGKIILSHDGNTNQQGDIRREIAKTDFEELRKINIANFFNMCHDDREPRFDVMPTLEEALELFRNQDQVRLSLQPKAPGTVQRAAKIIRDMKFPVELIGFNDGNLSYMEEARAEFPGCYIFYDIRPHDIDAEIAAAKRNGFNELVVWEERLDQTVVERILDAGFPVGAWNVNNPGEMERFIKMGVSRFYTDFPAELLKINRRIPLRKLR
jgi:glycerophosphoryl diester phosphodiesterase